MYSLYRWLYSLLLYLLMPIEILRLLLRSRKAPLYRKRWSERFASSLPEINGEVIWFHTVSVGETLAAVPVIKAIQEQYPDHTVLVTTMTPTGTEQVKVRLGDSVVHCYAPYDLHHAMRAFIRHIRPSQLFIMETELWLNMLHFANKYGVRVVLVNARMSEKSAKGYARFPTLTGTMLSSLSALAVQNATDAERFRRLGAPEDIISVTGNIKFDLKIPLEISQQAAALLKEIRQAPIWLAASTHSGEDEILLDAHEKFLVDYPQALLILVPRHPERFNEVFDLIKTRRLTAFRRTEEVIPQGQIYLADTMGELLMLCALADAVFVGGSLIERGGHNCLEPAAFKKPVMSGPSDFNFAQINQQLTAANALARVSDAEEIYQQLVAWQKAPELAEEMGNAGYRVVVENRGAVERLLEILKF